MEHSALHALQLIGLINALGGAFFVLALLQPAQRRLGLDPADPFVAEWTMTIARWVSYGALAAGLGTLADLFVQVAEVRGQTIFGGADLALVSRFALRTTVGNLCLWRAALLLLTAAAARARGHRKWPAIAVLATGAVIYTSLVSHAAAQPTARLAAIASQITHVAAASLWVGVLMHLWAARRLIQYSDKTQHLALISEIVRRFSPLALTAVLLMTLSGFYAAVRNLAAPAALVTSAYGLTLSVKLVLLMPALFAGLVNFRVVRPALIRCAASSDASTPMSTAPILRRFAQMIELEVTAGLLVITVAGIVGSVSPPGEDGSLRLTPVQVHALLSPDLPSAAFVDPKSFVGSLGDRPIEDLRYSEFTHNWSGVFVCFLGLLWLAQSWGGGVGNFAGRVWPLLLLPFAGFIMVFSDADVWLVPNNSVWSAISDPIIVEHQLGSVMVLFMAWLGWRDQNRPAAQRPLGYALPIIMVIGSVLLLGHAHSSLRVTDELTNLINVQHAVLGSLGLLAGTARWLGLRGLLPSRAAQRVWPALVIGLGLFLAFFYREVV